MSVLPVMPDSVVTASSSSLVVEQVDLDLFGVVESQHSPRSSMLSSAEILGKKITERDSFGFSLTRAHPHHIASLNPKALTHTP